MGLPPMRVGDSAGVAVRRPSIRVDSQRFFVEKRELVRMKYAMVGRSRGSGLLTQPKWEALTIFNVFFS